MIRQRRPADQTADIVSCAADASRAIIVDLMLTPVAVARVPRPNPRSSAAALAAAALAAAAPAALAGCGDYNPLGQATTEDATGSTSETGETTEDAPTTTTGPTEPPEGCDNDGECDPGEDVQNCPADCESPPGCGDMSVDGDEVCDDGANNGMYGFCNAECSATIECGDGAVNGDEACDDGLQNSDEYSPEPHCNAECSGEGPACGDGVCQADVEGVDNCPEDCTPVCGNGNPEPGEDCDDGDGMPLDSAACNADCTVVECGDEYVNSAAGETCDDGNSDDTDTCPSTCTAAFCGDNFVQAGVEACDDGDDINDNACGVDCVLPRQVFVSSLTKQGKLAGLGGADVFCGTLSEGAGLSSDFRAWLSDASEGPADRFDVDFTGAYKLVDGTVVASNGWVGLTTGPLVNPIGLNEDGVPVVGTAWTNTLPDGTPASNQDCSGWTAASGTSSVGVTTATDMEWTNLGGGQLCNVPMRLYCFEDVP
jgi:hypothetical protein